MQKIFIILWIIFGGFLLNLSPPLIASKHQWTEELLLEAGENKGMRTLVQELIEKNKEENWGLAFISRCCDLKFPTSSSQTSGQPHTEGDEKLVGRLQEEEKKQAVQIEEDRLFAHNLLEEERKKEKQKKDPFFNYKSFMEGPTFQAKSITANGRVNLDISGKIGKSVLYKNSLASVKMKVESKVCSQKPIPNIFVYHPYNPALEPVEYFPLNVIKGNNVLNVQISLSHSTYKNETPLPALLFRPHYIFSNAGNPKVDFTYTIWHFAVKKTGSISANFETHVGGRNEQIASPPSPEVPSFKYVSTPGVDYYHASGFALFHIAMGIKNYFTVLFKDEGGFKKGFSHFIRNSSGINFATPLQLGHVIAFIELLALRAKDGSEFVTHVKKAFTTHKK